MEGKAIATTPSSRSSVRRSRSDGIGPKRQREARFWQTRDRSPSVRTPKCDHSETEHTYAKGSLHSRRFSQRHALRRQPLKQGAGSLQIRGRETFGEPIINRCKRCSRLVVATLAHPQTGDAEGDPQLPEQSALLAGHLGRLGKAIFGRQNE